MKQDYERRIVLAMEGMAQSLEAIANLGLAFLTFHQGVQQAAKLPKEQSIRVRETAEEQIEKVLNDQRAKLREKRNA